MEQRQPNPVAEIDGARALTSDEPARYPQRARRSRGDKGMKVRLGSVIAVAFVALAACGDGGSPTDVTRAYLGAIADSDGKRACGLMTDDFKRGLTDNSPTASTCEQRIEELSAPLGSEGRQLVQDADLSQQGTGSALSLVRIESDERTPLHGGLVTLRKVDGVWRIEGGVTP
jgi:hypothetical protein